MQPDISREALLAEWQKQGEMDAAKAETIREHTAAWLEHAPLPRYLNVISGFGAFLAMFCFIGFLSAIKLVQFHEPTGMLFWGAIFTAAALWFSSRSKERVDSLSDSFVTQTTLILLAMGKVLFINGVLALSSFDATWTWRLFLSLLVVTAVTYPFSRFTLDRYLSSLATLLALFLALHGSLLDGFLQRDVFFSPITMVGYYLALLSAAATFYLRPSFTITLRPLRDAVLSALVIVTLLLSFGGTFSFFLIGKEAMYVISAAVSLSFAAVIVLLAGGLERVRASQTLMLAVLVALLLGALAAPGILLALLFMTVGYERHEKRLLAQGIFLFVVFLPLYYYNLEMTLLAKSSLLAGSGALLLLGRYYLHLTAPKEA